MKAILVGLGGRGRYWLGQCQKHPGVDVVAGVEPSAQNRERAVAEGALPERSIYRDLGQALNALQADFVLDVTPPAVHQEIAVQTFAAGLHLLGEKPLSDDYQAARRIVEAGTQAGVAHMITQNYRFNGLPAHDPPPAHRGPHRSGRSTRCLALRQLGRLARLALRHRALHVPHRHGHSPLRHDALQPSAKTPSARTPSLGTCLGLAPRRRRQMILFRFANGAIATPPRHRLHGRARASRAQREWRYEGPRGTLTWEGLALYHTHSHRADPQIRRQIPLDQTGAEGQNPVLSEFVAAVAEGRQPECNAADNLKSMAMVFAAVKSAREGREVSIAEL